MNRKELMHRLTSGETVSLAAWYGEPLSRRETEFWRGAIRDRLYNRGNGLYANFSSGLAEMIVRYWTGRAVGMEYDNLLATADTSADRARLELCYGQLLLARKLHSAWQHLDAGFAVAAHLFQPDEYFLVLKRHECLRHLVLSPVPADGAGLDELLTEAAVIRQLRGKRLRQAGDGPRHEDTVD